jgi:hypothetical protein
LGTSPHNTSDPGNKALVLAKGGSASTDAWAGAIIQNVTGMSLTELGYDFRAGIVYDCDSPHFVIVTTDTVKHTLGGCSGPYTAGQTAPATGWMRLRFDPKNATPPIDSAAHVQSMSLVLEKGPNQPGSTPTETATGTIVVIDNIDINGTFTGKSSSMSKSTGSAISRDE